MYDPAWHDLLTTQAPDETGKPARVNPYFETRLFSSRIIVNHGALRMPDPDELKEKAEQHREKAEKLEDAADKAEEAQEKEEDAESESEEE